jgi:hypothetical protein
MCPTIYLHIHRICIHHTLSYPTALITLPPNSSDPPFLLSWPYLSTLCALHICTHIHRANNQANNHLPRWCT